MIVVDTSALMAILLGEAGSDGLMEAIDNAHSLFMSAGTEAEAMIVATRRSIGRETGQLIEELGIEVVPQVLARRRLLPPMANGERASTRQD